MKGAFLIYKKEFLELAKDRKTLFFTVFLPILIYPILFGIIGKMGQSEVRTIRATASKIHLVDPSGIVDAALRKDPKRFELVEKLEGSVEQAIRDRKLDLSVEIEPKAADKLARQETFQVKALNDPSESASQAALSRFRDALRKVDEGVVQERLKAAGAAPQLAAPTKLETTDVGGANRVVAKIIGMAVPFLMVIMMLTGAMQQGIYATAGERERGTLQTLLATSIPRSQIILGKLLYIFSMGLISALINLLTVSITMSRLFITPEITGPATAQAAASGMSGLSTLTDPVTILLAFLILLPLGLFFANVILYLGIQSKNSQEAGTAIMPFMLVIMVLGYFSIAPGAEKMPVLSFVPVANVSLMIRKMIMQQMQPLEYVITLAMTLGLASLITWLSVRRLNDDEAIFKTS